MILASADGPVWMVYLYEVAFRPKIIQLQLLLGCQEGQQRVKIIDSVASKYQFMEFEGTPAMLVYIHLKGCVKGVSCELIVVGEGNDIVAKLFQDFISLTRPQFTLIGREWAFHPCMAVEQRPFPAFGSVQIAVWIENVRT